MLAIYGASTSLSGNHRLFQRDLQYSLSHGTNET